MTEPSENKEVDKPEEDTGVETFDMYHVFSRWDLILAIVTIVGLLLAVLYFTFLSDNAV